MVYNRTHTNHRTSQTTQVKVCQNRDSLRWLNRRGLTLLELLVVLVILIATALIIFPRFHIRNIIGRFDLAIGTS